MEKTSSNSRELLEKQKEQYIDTQKRLEKITAKISKYSQKHVIKEIPMQWQQTTAIFYS